MTRELDLSGAGGKVVDGSALVAGAKGSLAMATWREMAWAENLTFVVPVDARHEAVRARPEDAALIEYFLSAPNVVTRELPAGSDLNVIDERHDDGSFDPLAAWVAGLCRGRSWPVLTRDTERLRRVDPAIDATSV